MKRTVLTTVFALAAALTVTARQSPIKSVDHYVRVKSTVPSMAGAKCPECGAHAMIRKDGCDFCTQCGHVGACG